MGLISNSNSQLFDFSEVVDVDDLIRKIRTDLSIFLLMVLFLNW